MESGSEEEEKKTVEDEVRRRSAIVVGQSRRFERVLKTRFSNHLRLRFIGKPWQTSDVVRRKQGCERGSALWSVLIM